MRIVVVDNDENRKEMIALLEDVFCSPEIIEFPFSHDAEDYMNRQVMKD